MQRSPKGKTFFLEGHTTYGISHISQSKLKIRPSNYMWIPNKHSRIQNKYKITSEPLRSEKLKKKKNPRGPFDIWYFPLYLCQNSI